MDQSRTEILIGDDGKRRLAKSSVAIFGLGGVGGYAMEAIARAGVGKIYIFDFDRVTQSNINRQILALNSSMGKAKTEVAADRIRDINPDAVIHSSTLHIMPDKAEAAIPDDIDHAIDAIDEIESKVHLIACLLTRNIPFVSSMGAGNKLNPVEIRIADISETSYCPLARAVRKRLKKLGITSGVRCIYSEENLKIKSNEVRYKEENGGHLQGSISYMPGIFGLTAAGVVINDILATQL